MMGSFRKLRMVTHMDLRLQEEFDPNFITALLGSIDEAFGNVMLSVLEKATVYVIGDKEDDVLREITRKLEEKGTMEQLTFFKEKQFKNKEIVICIDGDRHMIDMMIIKVNVKNGNGYKTVSIVHFIKRIMEILQERKLIGFYTRDEERVIVDRIMFDVPRRFASSEVVTLSRMKELPYYI